MSAEAPWRCTHCGREHIPDAKTQLDPRYATAFCMCVEHSVPLVRAATIGDATRGYHERLDRERRARAARQELKKSER